jgi:protein ImuB
VQRLLCTLKLVEGDPLRFLIEMLRPSASKRDLLELTQLRVERLRIPAEVMEATVRIAAVAPLEFRQDEMFGGSNDWNAGHEAAGLLERLSSRLGEQAVLRPRLWPDAQPEFAYRYEPWLSNDREAATRRVSGAERAGGAPLRKSPSAASRFHDSPRPPFLKNHPLPITVVSLVPGGPPREFRWNGCRYLVERSWGPERIETGWWRGEDIGRDYFVVETVVGERFWMFRNRADGSWRLHGVFA